MGLEIISRSDGSEIVPYNNADFPLFTDAQHIMMNPYRRATWHWHDDWEFASISESPMLYHVDDREILLSPGEGIFVNSLRLHNNAVIDRSNPGYTCIVLHPGIFSGSMPVMEKYVRKLCLCRNMPYLILHRSDPVESQILEYVEEINSLERLEKEEKYIGIIARAAEIVRLLLSLMPESMQDDSQNRHITALYAMESYIQRSYQSQVSVGEIARAGYVSESTCTAIFKRFFGITPMRYVSNFRLEKAASLLQDTDTPILEIAGLTGFGSHSFFSKQFRALYGVTPREYRENTRSRTE